MVRRQTIPKPEEKMKICSVPALAGLAFSFAFPMVAQQTADPKVDEEWSNGDATDTAPVIIEGLPVKVISSGKSYKVFEQYPWEGHSSNYGPKGNRLNSSYGVGLGENISSALLLRHGDWIHMPDIGWRQINEFASKKDSIEFFARYRDEYKGKHPRITIDMVVFALPSEKDAKDMRDEYKRKHPRITIDSQLNQKAKSHRSP